VPNDIDYDPEKPGTPLKYRMPFALCKARGIQIQPDWTPRDAWNALRGAGVSPRYEYDKIRDKERARERARENRERNRRKREQLASAEHNPETPPYEAGSIAGAQKGAPMDFAAADGNKCNPYYGSDYIGYKTNCQTCAAVYFARRMGYDIQALPNLNNSAIRDLSHNVTLAYRDAAGNHPTIKRKPDGMRKSAWVDSIAQPGKIMAVQMQWRGRSDGHIVTAERIDGVTQIYDPQTGKTYKGADIGYYLADAVNLGSIDLTECTPDEEYLTKCTRRAGK
jgi:hypothetical protein